MTDIEKEKAKRFQRAEANLAARKKDWKRRIAELPRNFERDAAALGRAAEALALAMDEAVAALLDMGKG